MAIVGSEVGTLVSSLIGVGRSASTKDWVATGIGAGSLGMETGKVIAKSVIEKRIKDQIHQGENPWAAEVPIIEWGLVVVTVLEVLLGLGDATQGVEFDNASSKLDAPKLNLASAFPDSSWQGSASDEYAEQNRAQLNRVKLLQDLDAKMIEVLTAEVAALTIQRRAVAGIKDGLTACIFVALLISAYGSPASSLVFQKVVTIAAIVGVVTCISYMEGYSGTKTVPGVRAILDKYGEMIADMQAYLLHARVAPPRAAASAVESSVSDFGSARSGMTGPPGASAAPGGPDARPGGHAARYGGDDLYDGPAEPAEPAEPQAPQSPESPAAPTLTMPTLGQVLQMSGQAAKLSGNASQHLNLVNQTMGQVQQVAALAQPGQGLAAPAERAALVDDVEGAATGDESAERAPVDVAAVEPEPLGATPAERLV